MKNKKKFNEEKILSTRKNINSSKNLKIISLRNLMEYIEY